MGETGRDVFREGSEGRLGVERILRETLRLGLGVTESGEEVQYEGPRTETV